MANKTQLRGLCPPPFFDASKFGLNGFVNGRFCAPVEIHHGLFCCLPCPMTDYLYPPELFTWYRIAEWLNVVGLACLTFLLISFIVLPAEKTRRHYLSYGLIIAGILMALGFVIPLGARPEQCYDEITPHDMYSSLTCAFSGAFLVAGGLSFAVWIFIRALSMHLQICWDVTPGTKFFYWAQGLGWSVVAAFLALTLTLTGVSFRFGDVCHVNAQHSMSDLWGPLLAISGGAVLLQGSTFAYCIKVYLQNMFSDEQQETQSSVGLPSYTHSLPTRSARAVYHRVSKVLWLQWRGITLVLFVLVDVIFFSVAFIWLNAMTLHAINDIKDLKPWLICLLRNPTDPAPCYTIGQSMTVSESTVIAILMMLSVAGLQCFFLLVRWSTITGWLELFRTKLGENREFVSLDAKSNACELEMKNYDETDAPILYGPTSLANHSAVVAHSNTQDQFEKETQEMEREYRSPNLSFSTPQPRSQTRMTKVEWDPTSSHARGGLGLHPPDRNTGI